MLGQLEHASLSVSPTPPQTQAQFAWSTLGCRLETSTWVLCHAGLQGPLALESSSRDAHLCLVVGAASGSLQHPATAGAYLATLTDTTGHAQRKPTLLMLYTFPRLWTKMFTRHSSKTALHLAPSFFSCQPPFSWILYISPVIWVRRRRLASTLILFQVQSRVCAGHSLFAPPNAPSAAAGKLARTTCIGRALAPWLPAGDQSSDEENFGMFFLGFFPLGPGLEVPVLLYPSP